jgi:hypothetical protein
MLLGIYTPVIIVIYTYLLQICLKYKEESCSREQDLQSLTLEY